MQIPDVDFQLGIYAKSVKARWTFERPLCQKLAEPIRKLPIGILPTVVFTFDCRLPLSADYLGFLFPPRGKIHCRHNGDGPMLTNFGCSVGNASFGLPWSPEGSLC